MIFNIALQYQSDPSGNYGGWKATCIGNNWNAAVSMLKQEYKVPPKVKWFCVKVTDYMRDALWLESTHTSSFYNVFIPRRMRPAYRVLLTSVLR